MLKDQLFDTEDLARAAAWELAKNQAGMVFLYWIPTAKLWAIAPADAEVFHHWHYVDTIKPSFCVESNHA